MLNALRHLDRILRGEATSLPVLLERGLKIPAASLVFVLVVLAAIYGVCLGFYPVFHGQVPGVGWKQMLSSMVKIPALYVLTLLVTFPSLYVFNAMVGSRLNITAVVRLLVSGMVVMITVLASLGTVVAFFCVTSSSHPFILLLNVAVCALAGFLGMSFLLQTLHRLTVVAESQYLDEVLRKQGGMGGVGVAESAREKSWLTEVVDTVKHPPTGVPPISDISGAATSAPPVAVPPVPGAAGIPPVYPRPQMMPGALDGINGYAFGRHVKMVFCCWIFMFALVGAQMSWVLRPFIGKPDEPFVLFAPSESNFFVAVMEALGKMLGR